MKRKAAKAVLLLIGSIAEFSIGALLGYKPIGTPLKVEAIAPTEIVWDYEPIAPEYEAREFCYDDAQYLLKIAQAEAGNQGIDGMMLVMNVVLNRVASEDFPNTISEVINQKGQFESMSNGLFDKIVPSVEAHLALAEIEKGRPLDESIIGFETSKNGRGLEKYFDFAYRYKDHDFYTKKLNG